jgi:hypothetical protein
MNIIDSPKFWQVVAILFTVAILAIPTVGILSVA